MTKKTEITAIPYDDDLKERLKDPDYGFALVNHMSRVFEIEREDWCKELERISRLHNELVKDLNICNHPGCCCVCGHTKQCPEDGPCLTSDKL